MPTAKPWGVVTVQHRSLRIALVALATCGLALPAAASAATKTVALGPPLKKAPPGVPKDGDLNQFFPSSIAVHVGDSVKWAGFGFHLVNFPKKGEAPPPLASLDTSIPIADAKDAAGQPYWFNGQGTPVIPTIVGLGSGSGKSYDGTQELGSGFPAGEAPKPFVVKFPKAGTYTYYCVLHPGMKGTVKVVAKSKAVPSAKADAARVKAQLAKGIAALKAVDKQKAPADTVVAGPDKASAILYRFTPSALTTKVNTPITLTMSSGTSEDHTFTFAKDIKAAIKDADKTFIAPLPGTGQNGPPTLAFAPKWAFSTEAPGQPIVIDGANHGDGLVNSGVLDGDAKSPFPQKVTVSFSKPGTYSFFCAIHTNMTGKVTVTQ
jgi:plastocyanin